MEKYGHLIHASQYLDMESLKYLDLNFKCYMKNLDLVGGLGFCRHDTQRSTIQSNSQTEKYGPKVVSLTKLKLNVLMLLIQSCLCQRLMMQNSLR